MRPTLEEQIAISKLTDKECIDLLEGTGLMKVDFWFFRYINILWHIYHWNWFNIFTGENEFWNYWKAVLRHQPH